MSLPHYETQGHLRVSTQNLSSFIRLYCHSILVLPALLCGGTVQCAAPVENGAKVLWLSAFSWSLLGSPLWTLTYIREVWRQMFQLQLHLHHVVLRARRKKEPSAFILLPEGLDFVPTSASSALICRWTTWGPQWNVHSNSGCVEWGSRVCFATNFPGKADAAVHGSHFQ